MANDKAFEPCVVLVDFENLLWGMAHQQKTPSPEVVDRAVSLLGQLKAHLAAELRFVVVIGRAYADWEIASVGVSLQPLALLGLHPEYALTKLGKGSSDLSLSLDGQEILLTRPEILHFVIVGGDRDYMPLARRILERGRGVRIVGFEASTSGDLRAMVGPGNFIDAARFLDGREAHAAAPAPAGHEEPPAEPVRDEDLQRCVQLFLQFRERVRSSEVWLGPFYKAAMNDAFVSLTQEGRKAIVNRLKDLGAIQIAVREGHNGTPYAVVHVVDTHPLIRAALAAGPAGAPPAAG
jgi:hypothetical protein